MTNKTVLVSGSGYKAYVKCFDEENIHLQFDNFGIIRDNNQITLSIPIQVWENLKKADPKQYLELANMTDEDIRKKAIEEVDSRIRELSLFGKEDNMAKLIKMENYLVYGDPTDTKENQIKKGVSFLMEQRERQLSILKTVAT